METISANSFEELYNKAKKELENKIKYQVLFRIDTTLEDTNSAFIKTYTETAKNWQSETRPGKLHINHGEYLFKKGSPYEYIVGELKKKANSNRALFSMINMCDIVGSGDTPIPSFLVLQFGFEGSSKKTLYVSAYFRAIEVSRFLPVNLSEICLYIQKISDKMTVEQISCEIYSFKAYLENNFHCLERAEIDRKSSMDIFALITYKEYGEIIQLIDAKKNVVESIVEYCGIEKLLKALVKYNEKESLPDFSKISPFLEETISALKKLVQHREHLNNHQEAAILWNSVKDNLNVARDFFVDLRGEQDGI